MALSTQPHLSATDMIRSAFSSLALHAALVIIWLLRPGTLHAQGDVRHPDSLRIYCALDTPFIDQLFNAQFTKIIDPEANTNIGNYVALETKDAALTLGASSSFANGSILALKVSGGVDENIASIWADRNVNSNFSADVQYHFLHKPYRLGTDSANLERAPAKRRRPRCKLSAILSNRPRFRRSCRLQVASFKSQVSCDLHPLQPATCNSCV